MAIALLEQDGQLSVRDRMGKYLPEFPSNTQEITLENLLYHTSGIRNYTVLAYYMKGYHESDAITTEEIFDLLVRLRSTNFKAGERWEYSDSNYFLLGQIIERVTGKSLGAYVKKAIFDPLDMRDTLFRECHSQVIRNRAISYVAHPIAFQSPFTYRNQKQPSGAFYALTSNYEHVGAEGLFTTLGDLSRWALNFQDNRLGSGKMDLIERVLAPGACINDDISYGFGINVGRFKGKRFLGHGGAIHGYTSSMMHFRDDNVTIIVLSNHNLEGAWAYRDRLMSLIFSMDASQVPSITPSPPRKSNPDDQRIAGSYQNPETASIWEVFPKDGRVYIKVNKQSKFDIFKVEPSVYRAAQSEMVLRFEIDSMGKGKAIKGTVNEMPITFVRFLQKPLRAGALSEYAGNYRSDELQTTFNVTVDQEGLIIKNTNRHTCSMDLVYTPTIKDNFIAYDPHPTSSQITFLRANGRVVAFVYRDYDGDGREAIRFEKIEGLSEPEVDLQVIR